jgi:hypothetical protein
LEEKPLKKLPLFLLLLIFAISPPGHTGENCMELLKSLMTKIDSDVAKKVNLDAHVNHRAFVANFAKKNDIPVFMKQSAGGDEIPFILVNRESAPRLKNFIENSYGTDVALQPGYGNDHGLMRTGNYIIDVDAPGYRGYGEIHKTGLAWKEFGSYTSRRKMDSGVILEVSYLLTPEEKKIVDVYQRIRRAAIFRVKFSFKDFKTEDHPFLLNTGGEHCFIFCKAQAVTSHIYELQGKLQAMGVANPDEFISNLEIQKKLESYQDFILKMDPNDLAPELATHPKIIAFFEGHYPKTIKTVEQKGEFVRWLVSYDSSKKYNRVLKDLGVTSDYGVGDARNKRATAILVYDETVKKDDFNKGLYKTEGAFTSWPAGNQKPVE